jgi:heme/copper-type cytochrome/quinol oxidase subunit 2
MTTNRRLALLAGAIVIAIVAFIALKPSDHKKTAATGAPGATQPGGKPAPPPVTQIVVKNAKPVGGVKTITVNKGDQVRFTVSSDVSDEIHVHGYNFMKDVKAGGKVSFSFPATIDGEFEAELESRGEQILNLVVNP